MKTSRVAFPLHTASWVVALLHAFASVLAGCDAGTAPSGAPAVAAVRKAWDGVGPCSPIDPAVDPANLTDPPCFAVTAKDVNLIEIKWSVSNGGPPHDTLDTVYLSEDLRFEDPGVQAADCDADTETKSCSISLRVGRGGRHSYTIAVRNAAGTRVTVSSYVDIVAPTPPTADGGGHVDMFAATARTLSWSHSPSCVSEGMLVDCAAVPGAPAVAGESVRIREVGAWGWERNLPIEGSRPVTIPLEDVYVPPTAGALDPFVTTEVASARTISYEVQYCADVGGTGGQDSICSPSSFVRYEVGPARWEGLQRIQVALDPGVDYVDVTHSGDTGTTWVVTSDTLVSNWIGDWTPNNPNWVSPTTYRIPRSKLETTDYHRLTLSSCVGTTACSNRRDVSLKAGLSGTFTIEQGYPEPEISDDPVFFLAGMKVGTVTIDGTAYAIAAPTDGRVYFKVADGATVGDPAQNTPLFVMITDDSDVLHIEVDSPVSWTLDRPYTLDFYEGDAHAESADGNPISVTYQSDTAAPSEIWMLGEFTAGIDVFFDGELSRETRHLAPPLLRKQSANLLEPVRPFRMALGPQDPVRTTRSVGAESVTVIDGVVWFGQGGDLYTARSWPQNYSRVISFDPTALDSPSTEHDDRLCAYTLTTDGAAVVGVTGRGNRVWVGESRGGLQWKDGPRAWGISSFPRAPTPETCEAMNMLDYDDPAGVAAGNPLQRCPSFDSEGNPFNWTEAFCLEVFEPCPATVEGASCISTVAAYDYALGDFVNIPASSVAVGHVAIDPADGTVWALDPAGEFLSRLDPATRTIQAWPLPEREFVKAHDTVSMIFGSYPWTLRVTDDAVYFSEYMDCDVVRFDKSSFAFDQVHVPFPSERIYVHTIDIDAFADRLWFTISAEDAAPFEPSSSTIGYIDLQSWESHIRLPNHPPIEAATYAGLEEINGDGLQRGWHAAFTGIDVHQATGRLALASFRRGELVELVPRPSFRPTP